MALVVPFMPPTTIASVGFNAKNPSLNYTYPYVLFALD